MIDMSELIFTEHHTVLIDNILKQNEMIDQLYLSTKIYESIFYSSDDDDEKIKEKIKNVYYLFVNWLFQNNVFFDFKYDYPNEFDNIFRGTIFSYQAYENPINYIYLYLLDLKQIYKMMNNNSIDLANNQ